MLKERNQAIPELKLLSVNYYIWCQTRLTKIKEFVQFTESLRGRAGTQILSIKPVFLS